MKKVIQNFITGLEAKGFSQSFIETSRYHLLFFEEFCAKKSIYLLKDVSSSLVGDYQKHVFTFRKKGKQLSQAVQRKYVKTLDSFFNWCVAKNHLLFNPASKLRLPRVSKSLPKDILTVREMFHLLELPEESSTKGLRNKAILELLYATGIRKAELLALNILDINFKEREVFIKDGKGKKDRIIPISKRSLFWLEKYLQDSRPLYTAIQASTKDKHTLFFGEKGSRLGRDSIQDIVKYYLKKSGLTKAGSCHMFRHSMATHMLENGADIRYIQRMLGHKDLASTEIYLRVGIQRLIEVYSKTHPAAGLGDMKY